MGAHTDFHHVDIVDEDLHGFIVFPVRILFGGVDGGSVSTALSALAFLFQIGTSHDLNTQFIALGPCPQDQSEKIVIAVPPVQLQCCKDDGFGSVIPGHHLLGEFVDCCLDPALFRIDIDRFASLVRRFTYVLKPAFHFFPLPYLFC